MPARSSTPALTKTLLAFSFALLSTSASIDSAFAQAKPAAPPAAAPAAPTASSDDEPLKQIALTDKLVEEALATEPEVEPILNKIPEDTELDAKTTAQLDAIAKKHGFASYDEYDNVTENINLVLGGYDPQTKKYIGEEAVLKEQITQLQADKSMPAKDKKEALTELNDSLKSVTPLQFPDNTAVVGKYLDKLIAAMGQD